MRESGQWFSPRARSETLSSDDPPVTTPVDRPAPRPDRASPLSAGLTRLHGPAARAGTGWRLLGVWGLGFATVAATGMGIAAVLGTPPPVLSDRIERLVVFPGSGAEPGPEPGPAPAPATSLRAVPTGDPGLAPVDRDGAPAPTRPAGSAGSVAEPGPGRVTDPRAPVAPRPGTGAPSSPRFTVPPSAAPSPTGPRQPSGPATPAPSSSSPPAPAVPPVANPPVPPPQDPPPPVTGPVQDPPPVVPPAPQAN